MDRLWSPWRYDYIKSGSNEQAGQSNACVFCSLQQNKDDDAKNLILHRAAH
ncbi:MAG: HIT family hydrolase, partial [Pyrinomonadaceae bacterium]|nr:HIT family hydrolase [Pyrinomonadaceae bacterium]